MSRENEMTNKDDLLTFLKSIDGRPYIRYKELARSYDMGDFTLYVDNVQNDAHSQASRMRVRVSSKKAMFPEDTFNDHIRATALRDLIARRFWESCRMHAKGNSGGDVGGMISIPRPGQEILGRSSVQISEGFTEVRFKMSLPSAGRNAAGRSASRLFTECLQDIVTSSMFFSSYKQSKLYLHISTAENAEMIRGSLKEKGLAAFIGNGSILPRRDDGTAPVSDAKAFRSPDELAVTLDLPNGMSVEGMGIPEGFTAIIGGVGNGRTVLIDALSSGIYDHIPGDGREMVITSYDSVRISEDVGRTVRNVDASPFIKRSPTTNPLSSSTDNADRSFSSVVSVSEAIELGADLLIVDEDSVSPNLMFCDSRIREHIDKDEKVIPFTDVFRTVSGPSVIVSCNHSDLIDAADTVILMTAYAPVCIKNMKRSSSGEALKVADRLPMSRNMVVSKGRNEIHIVPSSAGIEYGETRISVPGIQLPDAGQLYSVAAALSMGIEMMDGSMTLMSLSEELVKRVNSDIDDHNKDTGSDMCSIRRFELAEFINRHPDLIAVQRS